MKGLNESLTCARRDFKSGKMPAPCTYRQPSLVDQHKMSSIMIVDHRKPECIRRPKLMSLRRTASFIRIARRRNTSQVACEGTDRKLQTCLMPGFHVVMEI
jgi:hypothetical protein